MPPQAKRILCVEDDDDTSSMLCSILGLINCEVSTAGTVADALDKIGAEHFDLYLLDSWLPGGGGVDLCRRIRDFDSTTPIVFYSGAAREPERQEALAAGAQAYLVKPEDIAKLVETVERLLVASPASEMPGEGPGGA